MTQGRPDQALGWMRDGTGKLTADLARLSDGDLDVPTALPGWNRRYLLSHVAANAEALRNLVHWARTGEERRMYASPRARDEGIKAGTAKPAAELRAWIGSSAEALAADLDALPEDAWDHEIITAQGLTRLAREIPWMRVREVYIHAVDLAAGTSFADLPEEFLAALLGDITARRSATGTTPALTLTAEPAPAPTADDTPGLTAKGTPGSTAGGTPGSTAEGTPGSTAEGTSAATAGGTPAGRSWQVTGSGDPIAVTAPIADLAAWLSGRPVPALTDTSGRPVPDLPAWL